MRVLLIGATGFIGGHLLRALIHAGHEVVACTRSGHPLPDVETIAGDFAVDHRAKHWLPRLRGIDAVINAVGIIRERTRQRFTALHSDAPRALFAACEMAGVRRVIQISALGADAEALSVYHLTKRAADDDLVGRDLDWLILRPSIVYGPGAHSSAFFRALATLPWVPLVGAGEQPIQPIYIEDLVRAVLAALKPDGPKWRRIDCVGPQPITFLELIARWRRWLGAGELRTFFVPYRLVLVAGKLSRFLGDAPVNEDAVRMLRRGNHADVQPFIRTFGFSPRTVEAALEAMPATEADRWHARLYFLRAPLRLALALLWIWSGIASAFFYPAASSYAMLGAVGITGMFAPIALYGAAILDVLTGLALWVRYRTTQIAALQIGLMLGYTVPITWALPDLWFHPFGPVAKNVPLLIATLILMALEARTR